MMCISCVHDDAPPRATTLAMLLTI